MSNLLPNYLIILLVLIALVLGGSTLASVRRVPWKTGLSQGLGSLLWASPVIAVLAFVTMRVLPHFQFGTANRATASAEPSWLQTETGTLKVENVDSFPSDQKSFSLDLEANPDESLPEWTSKSVQRLESNHRSQPVETWRVTLESGVDEKDWKLSEAEARESVAAKAAKLVEEDFQRFYAGGVELPIEDLKAHAVKQEVVTQRQFSKESDPITAYKVYWQVELSPKVREQLSDSWKAEIRVKRAWLLGGVFAMLTLIAGTFAAYFHLDQKSNGAHRFRLKMAATALMTAGALGMLATMSHQV